VQESNGRGCPFCRCEIKGTEPVVIDAFQPLPLAASIPADLRSLEHIRLDGADVSVVTRECGVVMRLVMCVCLSVYVSVLFGC